MQLVKTGALIRRRCSEAGSVVNQSIATGLGTIRNAMVGRHHGPVTQPALRALAALLAGRQVGRTNSVLRRPSLATQKTLRAGIQRFTFPVRWRVPARCSAKV